MQIQKTPLEIPQIAKNRRHQSSHSGIGLGIEVLDLVTQKLFGVFFQMDGTVAGGVALILVSPKIHTL